MITSERINEEEQMENKIMDAVKCIEELHSFGYKSNEFKKVAELLAGTLFKWEKEFDLMCQTSDEKWSQEWPLFHQRINEFFSELENEYTDFHSHTEKS